MYREFINNWISQLSPSVIGAGKLFVTIVISICVFVLLYSAITHEHTIHSAVMFIIMGLIGLFSSLIMFPRIRYHNFIREKYTELADQYVAIKNTTTDGFWVVNEQGIILDVNQSYSKMSGYNTTEIIGQNIVKFKNPLHAFDIEELLLHVRACGSYVFEGIHTKKNGDLFNTEVNITYQAQSQQYIWFIRDITERKQIEQEMNHNIEHIQYLAYHDVLTKLPNRVKFNDFVSKTLASTKRSNLKAGLIVVDLDNFKQVNDSMGHAAGDYLLKSVAERMNAIIRESDMLSRLGGDEFALIVTNLDPHTARTDIDIISRKLVESVRHPFFYENQPIYMSISVGAAIFPDHSDQFDSLFKAADTAMYDAKMFGRNTYRIFTAENLLIDHHAIRNELYTALEQTQLEVFYQPQVDMENKLCGMEALIRWRHPKHGVVSPGTFLPVAEETNLICDIGGFVLLQSCLDRKKMDIPAHIRVAVNLSARQFYSGVLLNQVMTALEESKLPPTMLELEITETIALQEHDNVLYQLSRLKEIGIKISMDDFGTGYSSLSNINTYPLDTLKVDQSFAKGLPADEHNATLITAIISMAKSLKLRILAEGVETKEQFDFLKDKGCDYIQGYYISPPLSFNDFQRKIKNWI